MAALAEDADTLRQHQADGLTSPRYHYCQTGHTDIGEKCLDVKIICLEIPALSVIIYTGDYLDCPAGGYANYEHDRKAMRSGQ